MIAIDVRQLRWSRVQVRAPIRAVNMLLNPLVEAAALTRPLWVATIGGPCTGSGIEDGVGDLGDGARPVSRALSDEGRAAVSLHNIRIHYRQDVV